MQRMPYLHRSISTKEPNNQWLFCKNRPVSQGILFSPTHIALWSALGKLMFEGRAKVFTFFGQTLKVMSCAATHFFSKENTWHTHTFCKG